MGLRRFESGSESQKSSVSSFRRRPESRGVGMGKCSAVEDYARRGAVPRWGRGGAWQNSRCQFAVPSHNTSFSYLGVPAPAGMSDWYESMSRTPIRDDVTRLSSAPFNLTNPRSRHSPRIRHSREGGNPRTKTPRRNDDRDTINYIPTGNPAETRPYPDTGPESRRGGGNVVRGLVPRWGRGGARQHPPCQFAEPSHNPRHPSRHWCEDGVTPLRKRFGVPEIFRIVIPAKAGIQRGGDGEM